MGQRVDYIDMAKGLSMVTIVMLHVTSFNLTGDTADYISLFNHCFNTRLFFFLSGMVAALGVMKFEDWYSIRLFLDKKTRSLLLPFFVWSVVIFPYVYNRVAISDFPQLLLEPFVPPFNGYWFLLYLYVIQLLFMGIQIISNYLKDIIPNDLFRELLICILFSVVLFPIIEYVLFFLMGYFVYRYKQKYLFSDVVSALSFCLFIILFTIYRVGEAIPFISRVLLALSASDVVISVLRRIGDSNRKAYQLLGYIGRHSLEVYLIHYLLVSICKDVNITVSNIHAIPLYSIIFVISFVVCIICCLIADFLRGIPYVSFLLFGKK